MKFSKIALAAAAALVAGSALAAPNADRIALSAGASAVQGNITTAVRNLCTNAGGTPTNFVSGNFTTVVCANSGLTAATYVSKPNAEFINFAGLPFAEFRLNVADGSFGSVLILNGRSYTFQNPATGTQTTAPAGAVVIGGFSDVETSAFPDNVIGTNTIAANTGAGVAQTFGVAATKALYTKLFDAQKAAGLIPASCGVNDTAIAYCVPSIAKAQMATIMANNEFNAAYIKGLGFLTGDAADDGVELRYVRRVDTSGTQASAQNYFLGLNCSKAALTIVNEPTVNEDDGDNGTFSNRNQLIGAIRVYATGGTGNVRDELNKLDADLNTAGVQPVYGLGVMSGENNRTSQNYRWLRVDGAMIGENAEHGTAGLTNANTLKNGSYSFYYELTYTGGNPTNDGYLGVIASALNTLAAPIGLVNKADLDAGYSKGGLTCAGSSSN